MYRKQIYQKLSCSNIWNNPLKRKFRSDPLHLQVNSEKAKALDFCAGAVCLVQKYSCTSPLDVGPGTETVHGWARFKFDAQTKTEVSKQLL
jgi:hypothetical protein